MTRRLHTIVAMAVIIVSLPGCGDRQPPVQTMDEQAAPQAQSNLDHTPNAATEYRRIYQKMGKLFLEPLAMWDNAASPQPAEKQYLNALQDNIRSIIAASNIQRCDFGVKYREGVETEAPHGRWILHFSRLLAYDARRFAKQPGGERASAERLAAILRMARHAGEESIIISRLIAYACVENAASVFEDHQDRFVDPSVKSILNAAALEARDSSIFKLCPVIPRDLEILKTTIQQSSGSLNFGLGEIAIAESDKTTLIAEIEQVFSEVQKHCDAPDVQQQLIRIDDSIQNDKVRQLTPRWDQFFKQMERARTRLDSVIVGTQ